MLCLRGREGYDRGVGHLSVGREKTDKEGRGGSEGCRFLEFSRDIRTMLL